MIERWHFIFSGFQQSRARACGMEALWLKLSQCKRPTCSVEFNDWNVDVDGLAAFTKRTSKPLPTIFVYGYSWGGNAAVEFCKALEKKGLFVDHVVLCDAVRRIPSLTRVLSGASMFSFLKLTVPANVMAVTYFTQTQNRPAGHKVVAAGEYTKIIHGGELERRHEHMDEAPEFLGACAAVAGL